MVALTQNHKSLKQWKLQFYFKIRSSLFIYKIEILKIYGDRSLEEGQDLIYKECLDTLTLKMSRKNLKSLTNSTQIKSLKK